MTCELYNCIKEFVQANIEQIKWLLAGVIIPICTYGVKKVVDYKLDRRKAKKEALSPMQTEAIKEVHIHLSNIYNSVKGLRVIKDLPFSSIDENTNKAIAEEIQAFYKIWPMHKLYFNRDLAKKIEKSVELCFKAVSAILLAKNESVAKQIECHLNVNITDYIGEQDHNILDGVIMDIEKEFRSILGIEN